MANPEHLKKIKKGVDKWNSWRGKNPYVVPDLSEADLRSANLYGANLYGANLKSADLGSADLYNANLEEANLERANLERANLEGANLYNANLYNTNLGYAKLERASLIGANLYNANLEGADLFSANLRKADLYNTNLRKADLRNTNLSIADVSFTNFNDVDLSECKGLDSVTCSAGPANVGPATLIKSRKLLENQPKVFNKFLEICGFPQQFIDYIPSLIQSLEPIQFVDCFLSYAGEDRKFAERLFKDLRAKGVQCWYDQENAVPGDDIKGTLRREIHMRDKMVLILSENSITKPWVFMEANKAMEEEESRKKPVLIPIRLDDTVFDKHGDWVDDVKKRFIGDFIDCENDDAKYQKALDRLLVSLQKDRVELI